LFDEWEVLEEEEMDEEMDVMCETMDILLDIDKAIWNKNRNQ
jgi:hypothetical protein